MTKAQEIRQLCKEANVSVNKMLKLAGLDKNLIFNWDKNEPYQFTAEKKIKETIKKIKDEHTAT